MRFIDEKKKELQFTQPIVGIHVRRTDKLIREAAYHGIDEYMHHVKDWFDTYEKRYVEVERKVYIATDDPSCVTEAKNKYPKYTFTNDNAVSETVAVTDRYNYDSLIGALTDIHLLSICNHIVCTLSSTLARTVYELKQTNHGDASSSVTSLDKDYWYMSEQWRVFTAIQSHTSWVNGHGREIELHVGDTVIMHANGFFTGTNTRTNMRGFCPSYKVKEKVRRVKAKYFLR